MFSSSPAANNRENGAHIAHVSDRVEDEDSVVGSNDTHAAPMAAHASNGVWTPVGLRRLRLGGRGNGKCLKCFGGPGEIRTHDLFHAMEARSQLRHRPLAGLFHYSIQGAGSCTSRRT